MDFIDNFLKDKEEKGLKRVLREVTPISARECIVYGKKCLNFSSNNYLALANYLDLTKEAIKWTEKYGTGSQASRLVTGTFPEYIELEQRIAAWKGMEGSMIFASGYMANIGVIPALADRNTVIFADKLNHASLNAGCQLSGAKFIRYQHNDMEHLQLLLKKHAAAERKFIVSDTVFSMDGNIANVNALNTLSKAYGALLYLDDAHATGVFGEKGEGLANGNNCDIAMGTFSKAMGAYGAYIACSEKIKEYLINRCASFIYTTSLPPGNYGAISAAVELVQTPQYSAIRENLRSKCMHLRSSLQKLNIDIGNSETPIIPLIIGDSEKTILLSEYLLEKNILAVAIRPPTVPVESARIRLTLNSAHTESDLTYLVETLRKTGISY